MNDENNLFSFNPLTSEEVVKTVYSLKKDHYDVTLYQSKYLRCLVGRFYHI